MPRDTRHICPVESSGNLDNGLRRFIHNPKKILTPLVRSGMRVLDMGCGPGFFTLRLADLVGDRGRVYAADLQPGMLAQVERKIRGTVLESRVILHQCEETRVGVEEHLDFVLAFYVVHELPDQAAFFAEMRERLRPGAIMLMVEPPFHVSRQAFSRQVQRAADAGFIAAPASEFRLSPARILELPE